MDLLLNSTLIYVALVKRFTIFYLGYKIVEKFTEKLKSNISFYSFPVCRLSRFYIAIQLRLRGIVGEYTHEGGSKKWVNDILIFSVNLIYFFSSFK